MPAAIEERKAETRDMIMLAARKVFSEKGYHKAQISDIVRKAGISTGSIYAHFRDKRDLFEQVSRENLEALRAQLQDLRKTTRPDDFAGRVETWKLTYSATFFDFVDLHPQELLMIVGGGFGVDEKHDQSLLGVLQLLCGRYGKGLSEMDGSGLPPGPQPVSHGADNRGHVPAGRPQLPRGPEVLPA